MTTTADLIAAGWHSGRSWTDTHIEDGHPCVKQPCGLVDLSTANPDCTQHPIGRGKSMRQGHPADRCPGGTP